MVRCYCLFTICVAVGLVGLSSSGRADDRKKADATRPAKADPAKELAAIEKEWAAAQGAFLEALQKAKTTKERQQVLKEKRPKGGPFAERCLKLAETQPDSPVATQALFWVLFNAPLSEVSKKATAKLKDTLVAKSDLNQLHTTLASVSGYGMAELAPAVAEKVRKDLDHPKAPALLVWVCSATAYAQTPALTKLYNQTVDLLMDKFADRKELLPLCSLLAMDEDPAWAEKHLRTLHAKNPSDDVRRQAKFSLASVLKNKDVASQPEAEKLFQSVIEELGKNADKSRLVKEAQSELDDMKLRGLGRPAPDIAGSDLDGKAFKLSDYKGKVVLLDFWGFW
jgi:AhpC/TSA family